MRITFIIPHTNLSGGVLIILGYAGRLALLGHHVNVMCPTACSLKAGSEFIALLRTCYDRLFYKKPGLVPDNVYFKKIPTLQECHMPDADVIVATAWASARPVSEYSHSKGKKYYLF